jgi:flagellar basal-body rod modification protein FlgD
MNGITSAQAPFNPVAQSANMPNGNLGKEDFMKLLVAQLGHQDPLKPTDPGEFVAQLSQFSSLEQLVNIKSGLDLVAVTQTAGTSAQMVSFIGKDVAYDGGSVVWKDGQSPVSMSYDLATPASELEVRIADAEGNTIETRKLPATGAGPQSFTFDGKKENGAALGSGTYVVEVTAIDGSGNRSPVSLRTEGRVTGVTFDAGYPQLVLADGRTLGLAQVLEVLGGDEPTSSPLPNLPESLLTDPTEVDEATPIEIP